MTQGKECDDEEKMVRLTGAVTCLGYSTTNTEHRLFIDSCSLFKLFVPNLTHLAALSNKKGGKGSV